MLKKILQEASHAPRAHGVLNPVENEIPKDPMEVEHPRTEPIDVRDRLREVLVGTKPQEVLVRQFRNPSRFAQPPIELGAWIRREERDAHVMDAREAHAREEPDRLGELAAYFVRETHDDVQLDVQPGPHRPDDGRFQSIEFDDLTPPIT